jgi:octaprenyl-diphosphate synthase
LGVVISLDEERRETPVDRLKALVETDLTAVNEEILHRMRSEVELIPELADYLISSGGKRLRPMLTLAAAKLCAFEGSSHIALAAAVEFIHTATLLHDDVVDGSELRRGKQAANLVYGNQASVLVGDFLFSRSFQLMVTSGHLRVLDILSNAAAVIAEGEVLQLATANNTATTEDTYLAVIQAKTAALFAAATQVGAVVAARPDDEEAALESYGRNLGIAFQLVDDALDYSGNQAKLGKSVGDDFREGKITLPVVLAFRRGSTEERDFWKRTMEKVDQSDADLEHAMALLEKHGTVDATIERARHYGAIAKDALAIFPESETKVILQDLVEFVISRGH